MRFLCAIMALVLPCSAEVEQKILYWDALNTEAGIRRAVEDAFPSLRFGFYHWTGNLSFGQEVSIGRVYLESPKI